MSQEFPPLPILFQDEHFVAINKPHNLLVHRSSIAADESVFALQLLRDQLNCWVSPCHRLDRKTSGVLLFALSAEADKEVKKQFEAHTIQKKYLALVRGYLPETGMTDRPLEREKGGFQDAITHFRCLQQVELQIEVSRYPTSRYSLAEISPETGRMHQIRRHFAQLRHYLIGDKTYGECKHNKMFEEKFDLHTMLLHAQELVFTHPFTQESTRIIAPMNEEFTRILAAIGMNTEGL
ncbi:MULTISPECIES: pseudouridine synthase [unclassified Arcicella]|uniref:pseudouridine synthase n=1 Tax=unclassified Arcicella TaxID=2644986 RepID=UPI0028556AB0|nr:MULTISPECIES: pseudouridine synthase [unclassified Arcicella]MDR6563374.1 tRNA pseudouridine65 synthase [Arcicella sp. BE51]MDR6813205.1 tRNA pseudouridine65 synthase [Arcicella sp. BE140]MDR6824519.1 tRNA pseudouridine65 synthase [Arcicella sp. BE139]